MARISVLLKGGLGNQMFQYAFAKSLAHKYKAKLYIDNYLGFKIDKVYKRKYELDKFNLHFRQPKFIDSLPFLMDIYGLGSFFNRLGKRNFYKLLGYSFYRDKESYFMKEILTIKKLNNIYLDGYWQSHLYFNKIKNIISKELIPPAPKKKSFLNLGDELNSNNSVALCIRFYEESSNPGAHSFNGKLKTPLEINNVIKKLNEKRENLQYYVFATHYNPLFKKLNLPRNTKFITHEDFEGTLERLWLMTMCQNHIFTNSSYYWWAAWLAPYVGTHKERSVYAADNFINRDCYLSEWELF